MRTLLSRLSRVLIGMSLALTLPMQSACLNGDALEELEDLLEELDDDGFFDEDDDDFEDDLDDFFDDLEDEFD